MNGGLRVIRGADLSDGTAQTSGMRRAAAISGEIVGAKGLWMGRTIVLPGTSSGDHHHGESETGIYVVSGNPAFVFRDPATGDLVRLETRPGDYVWVPPHVPHREENPSPDTEAVVVIARSTQEAIVVNVPALLLRCWPAPASAARKASAGEAAPSPEQPDPAAPGRRSLYAGGDRPRAFQSLGVCRVHLQVVDDTLVDHFCLGRGHPDDPVTFQPVQDYLDSLPGG